MRGKVYLVGAGPGDPELLTVKANRLISRADVILFDSLVSGEIHELFPDAAIVHDVGKKPGPAGERTTQQQIHELMVGYAREGRLVVRLKGGDPTVYGRGGEEAEFLASKDIYFEIVPGVTSVVAGTGPVGIPLTHRSHSSAVTVITGHETPTKSESALDWIALAAMVNAGGTLVILMGVRTLRENTRVLRENGVPPEVPVATIERATRRDESTVVGTLASIADDVERANVISPAITVVGDVVSVREQIERHLDRDGLEELSQFAPTQLPSAKVAMVESGKDYE